MANAKIVGRYVDAKSGVTVKQYENTTKPMRSWDVFKRDRRQRKKKNRFRFKPKKTKFDAFYESREWLEIRYFILKNQGRVCVLCRETKGIMHVDHIQPRSLRPDLEYDIMNLQVLCKACNLGKSNKDSTDFRTD